MPDYSKGYCFLLLCFLSWVYRWNFWSSAKVRNGPAAQLPLTQTVMQPWQLDGQGWCTHMVAGCQTATVQSQPEQMCPPESGFPRTWSSRASSSVIWLPWCLRSSHTSPRTALSPSEMVSLFFLRQFFFIKVSGFKSKLSICWSSSKECPRQTF